jgi:hypothetical protein
MHLAMAREDFDTGDTELAIFFNTKRSGMAQKIAQMLPPNPFGGYVFAAERSHHEPPGDQTPFSFWGCGDEAFSDCWRCACTRSSSMPI